ncbi:aquaporin [Streptomyces wuyuanensis]|uniref:aquaporin n=1 Tax=Streptomyces wuyuanensis TaxID=1196353 RepID=UPI0034379F72
MITKPVLAEFTGTAMLVFFGVGAAVLAGRAIGAVGVALVFGLVLLALAHVLGPVSGCHLNPAVTLGMLFCRRITARTAVAYAVAQTAGGVAGSALLFGLARSVPGLVTHGAFGTNGFGARSALGVGAGGAFLAETMLTMLLVFVVLGVTRRRAGRDLGGVCAGLTLVAVNLVGIPLTACGVNPARSLGPALFAGGPALSQVWLFLLAPLVGALIAGALHRITSPVPKPVEHTPPVPVRVTA